MLPFVLLVTLCVAGTSAQDSLCQFILQKDCSSDPTAKLCATNNVTYRNRCEYAKIYCVNKSIHIAYGSECKNEATTTTAPVQTTARPGTNGPTTMKTNAPIVTIPTTQGPINGSLIALDIFCLDLSYVTCPQGGARVCGTDGKYYENACEFDKERCFHRELHQASSGCV